MKRKLFIVLLALLALAASAVPALALTDAASHSYYQHSADPIRSQYGKIEYLNDTLTIAGSGVGQQQTFTVYALEQLAYDAALHLGYEGTYSLLTRGEIFSKATFTGLKLYDFLLYCGLDAGLPDGTPVRIIAKDGYTMALTLGKLRSTAYCCYDSLTAAAATSVGLPVLLSFGSNGVPLVGPVDGQAVYTQFTATDGYVEAADNVGGPLRLTVGQLLPDDYNAPGNSKWLAAIVVGDANGYTYDPTGGVTAEEPEIDMSGNWRHSQPGYQSYNSYALYIHGSEAVDTVLTLAELATFSDLTVRTTFAASGGKNIYQGIVLAELIDKYLAPGVERPSAITVVSADGYRATLQVSEVYDGITSLYQPGLHREITLAYAMDGAPLVPGADSVGYSGANAYGPLRLVVENTISSWVKNVGEIILGEEEATGTAPAAVTRGAYVAMLVRVYGLSAEFESNFADVPVTSEYYQALGIAKACGLARGWQGYFRPDDPLTATETVLLTERILALK